MWMALGDGLVRSVDGGATWQTVSIPTDAHDSPQSIHEVHQMRAVQLLPRSDGSCFGWGISNDGQIYHSTDGDSWRQQQAPLRSTDRVICLDVLDEKHAWISGVSLTWRTVDGGETWQVLQSDGANGRFKDEEHHQLIHFRDPLNGVVLSRAGYLGCLKRVTSDGGRTWKSTPFDPTPQEEVQEEATPRGGTPGIWRIMRSGRAIRVFTPEGKLIYAHGDFPISQSALSNLLLRKSLPGGPQIFPNHNHQYGVVSADLIVAMELQGGHYTWLSMSRDAGQSWTRQFVGSGWKSIDFVDRRKGIAVGPNGRVSRTEDGGETWEHRFLPTAADFKCVQLLDDRHGWLGGGHSDEGTPLAGERKKACVWRTRDGGATWRRASFNNGRQGKHQLDERVLDLAFQDTRHGCVVTRGSTMTPVNGYTEYGRILRTDDGGVTWEQVHLTIDGAYLESIHCQGNSWFAAGYTGILHSSDGKSWATASNARGLKAVTHTTIDGAAIAGGNMGVMAFHPDEKLRQWRPCKTPRQSAWIAIDFDSTGVGWMVGNTSVDGAHNGVLRTTDAGASWTNEKVLWPASLTNVIQRHFVWSDTSAVDSEHAWVVGTSYGHHVILRYDPTATTKHSSR